MNAMSLALSLGPIVILVLPSSSGSERTHVATSVESGRDIPERKLGKTVKIKSWGYSLRTPKDWVSMPQQPGKTRVVGSWSPDQKIVERRWDEASMNCRLKIVRFPVKGVTTGAEETDEEKEAEKKKKEAAKRNRRVSKFFGARNVETLDDYIEQQYEGAKKRYVPKKIVAGSGKSKLTGQHLEFTSGQSFICAATFRKDDHEWGVFYEASENWYAKEWKKLFIKSIKSFKLFKATGKRTAIAPGVDSKDLSPADKRVRIKTQIAGNPGWWAYDTKNYVFLSNSKNKSFIRQLGGEIETIRAKVYEKLFPPAEKITAICIVRVFSDQSEYHQYGGPHGSAGYWNSRKEELVLFEGFGSMSKAKSNKSTKSVMYHEAFHQYIHYSAGDMAPHSWFNEGHGDFFAGAVVRGGKVSFKMFNWRVAFLKRHLQRKKGLIPIRSLVRLPQSEYYSNAGLKYSQGWALIYFLRHVTKNKRWRQIPDLYFAHLRDNMAAFKKTKEDKDDTVGESIPGIPGVRVYNFEDSEKVERILEGAVDKGFDGVDYEKIDVAFQRWVKSIT